MPETCDCMAYNNQMYKKEIPTQTSRCNNFSFGVPDVTELSAHYISLFQCPTISGVAHNAPTW